MVAQAEALHTVHDPSWMVAASEYPELWDAASEQTCHFLGSISLADQVEVAYVPEHVSDTTLLAGLQTARFGDADSLAMVRTNVLTDVSERLYKVAHQTKVDLQFTGGKLIQNNRALTEIHRNTFQNMRLNPTMKLRTERELRNAYLFEQLHDWGVLQTHSALVFSCAPDDAETIRDYGFYADTASCSIQLLQADGHNATLETAMVAGKKTADSPRHDLQAIRDLANSQGIDSMPTNEEDMLQFVMLVPNHEIPGGITDIVRKYDQASGGTFYGQNVPVQDYAEYARFCESRNDQFMPMVESITAQLLEEASGFKTPIDAILRLDELSERFCVDRTVRDNSLDSAIFGVEAAYHIQIAREFMSRGEFDKANDATMHAKQTANSGSCPIFKEASLGNSDGDSDGTAESGIKKWMSCPFCQAKVFGDPCAKKLSCWDCKAAVANGKVVSEGDGGRSKRRELQKVQPKPKMHAEYALAE
jgi:hypothetical protein